MPSGHTRRKDDTWTSEELNKALKGSKHEMLRKKRGDEEGTQRHHSDDVKSSTRRRDPDGRSHRREEEDKKSRRPKDRGDSPDQVALTEEEREKLRQERRTRREGGKEHQDKKTRPKESKPEKITDDGRDGSRKMRHKDGDEDHYREKTHHRDNEPHKRTTEKGERRRYLDDGDGEHRHHKETAEHAARKKRDRDEGSSSRRHNEDSNQRRHLEGNKTKQQITETESRHQAPKHTDNGDEEEREKRRQERREKREREKNKDREKDREKNHGSRVRNEKSERDQTGSRHRKEVSIDRDRDRDGSQKDKDRDRSHKDRDRDGSHKDRDRDRAYKNRDIVSDREMGKQSSQRWKDQEEPGKRSSRDQGTERESEKQSRRHYEQESAQVSSSLVGHLKSEGHASDDDDGYNYEEDFEDYEDDFDDDDEGEHTIEVNTIEENEVDTVLRALDEENNKLVTSSRKFNRSEPPEPSEDSLREDTTGHQATARPKKSFINFVSAKQRVLDLATSGKARKRFDDLSRLIELDVVEFDMFDLQPVKEYEMYIRSFGRSDTKQAYVQTRDDDIDKDVQTEETETLSKWTQHPPDEEEAVGGEGISVKRSEHRPEGSSSKTDIIKLSQFLDRVGTILFTVLDEESKICSEEDRKQDGRSAFSFCTSSSQLGMPNFLQGHKVIALSFCQSEPDYLLSVHSMSVSDFEKVQSTIQNVSFTCVWKLSQPAYPYRICGSQMGMRCACFSPTKAYLVFAGMNDGSVALWDLREPSSEHRTIKVGGIDHLVRFPTYNTARVLEPENHHSPVMAIVPVYSSIVGSQNDEEVTESSSGLSFQLASVEEKAIVNLWVVAEVAMSDPAGSETDLGLSPGGKLKLLRSSSITLSNPNKYQTLTLELRAVNLHLDPHDLNHFYVGTDNGHIIHGVRFGKRAYPHSHCSVTDSPVAVVSLDFSPFGQAYFLAGCDDGTLHLFHTKLENPIATWRGFTSGEKIVGVRWSHSRATVFFVLDNNSTVFTFDLVENGLGPVQTDKMMSDSVTSMEVGADPNLLTPGSSRPAYMVMALASGTIEVLTVSDEMRKQQLLEEEFLSTYVDRY